MAEYVELDRDNVDVHHLCCALGDPKHEAGVERKKVWLKKRFTEGLVFRKLDVRGKVFIEYAPAEVAWRPIVAPGWLVVHCLWVSGRFAKQGHGRALVEHALADAEAKGKLGLTIAAAKRKRPFLSDPKFLEHLGFEVFDEAGEFRLYGRRVAEGGADPRFSKAVHAGQAEGATEGPMTARYTDQCPFNPHWSAQMADTLRAEGELVDIDYVKTRKQAQTVASPLGTFGLEQGGRLVTHHLQTDNAVRRLLAKR